MENVNLESENRSELHFEDVTGGSAAVGRVVNDIETFAPPDSIIRISGENGTRRDALYRAVMALSRAIAGCTDLRSLLAGAAESLRQIVSFDHVALILHDSNGNAMQGHILNEPCNPVITSLRLPVDQDPAGWVWLNQRPLVLTSVQSETRWPEFVRRARDFNITTLMLVPLTTGNNRLGAFGFSSVALLEPSPAEIAFLERVASEFAVAVESFLAKQVAVRERDRLRTLFDITDALVSKLDRDELFSAISDQLSKVIRHDCALLTLCNETGSLDVYALHSTIPQLLEALKGPFNPVGMPAEQVLASGKPVVACEGDIDRYPNPNFRRFLALGFKSICSVPLIARNRIIGTLALNRMTDDAWTPEDVEFLVQVASQIAMTVSNSLAFRELGEIKERLATEKLYLEDEIRLDQNIGNMVGEGPGFQSVVNGIQTVAPTGATVLIMGETGTGKELVARAIHDLSGRSKGSLVKVNCAAIPASLLESELFGHEKGSFTGAVAQKIGRFELAHGGTLFLDEIGEMPLELQPKLLRAIQDQEFERVGGNRTIRTDARLVAATNRDLKAMVEDNQFRADLYYRLHVFPLNVPPLRDRREDIPLLTRYFVQKHAHRMGRNIDTIPTSVLDALTNYPWPGNIRELQNVLERSVILTNGSVLQVPMTELTGKAIPVTLNGQSPAEPHNAERARILKALEEARGQVGGPDGAAARLGLKRTTLQSRMRKFNISRQFR
ncbi:MAG: Sigma-54 dependent transcriptional regulator (Modular protein) [Candidatus Solibacter sp.]|jgi:formate hydrogenlyase transcriptional activator|nr:Sigma-54 dependent transcriptional regulator (Modular protein) [Candidatus Solibacter sp.]